MDAEALLKKLEPAAAKDNEAIARQLLDEVASKFYLTVQDLTAHQRDAMTTLARQLAMYLIRQETDYSLEKIGQILGDRTPATISWGYQRIAEALIKSPLLRRKAKEIKAVLKSN